MTADRLIANLVRDLEPVTPLSPPGIRAGQWVVLAVTAGVLAVATLGVRDELAATVSTVPFQVHGVLLLIATVMSAGAAMVLAAPGERLSAWRAWAALLAAVAWGAWLAGELGLAAASHTIGAWNIDQGWGCVGKAVAIELVPGIALFTMLGRGAAIDTRRAAMFGGLAVVGVGALGLEFGCPNTLPMHLLIWHAGPVLVFTVVAAFAGGLWLARQNDLVAAEQ